MIAGTVNYPSPIVIMISISCTTEANGIHLVIRAFAIDANYFNSCAEIITFVRDGTTIVKTMRMTMKGSGGGSIWTAGIGPPAATFGTAAGCWAAGWPCRGGVP